MDPRVFTKALRESLKLKFNTMGQYFCAINIDDMEHVSPYDFDNGAKLMEHSYIGNNYVEAIEFLLIEGARWHKKPIVWAGDYADGEDEDGGGPNLYMEVEDTNKLKMLIEAIPEDHHFLVNYDNHQYVDKRKCPKANDKWQSQIHPLPLLTSEGNGRGGGDYHGDSMDYVGTWARCRLGLTNTVPEGFTELIPNFKEQ